MFANLKSWLNAWRPALSVLERGALVFPLAVVLLATASFWWGGVCALWQVYDGFAVALGVMFADRRHAWGARLKGSLLLLCTILAVWVLVGCFAIENWDDTVYHLPVIRLLMLGWNPLYEAVPTEILEQAGVVSMTEFRPWHVLFISHSVEVFGASFGLFLRNFFCPMMTLPFFLLPATAGIIWRTLRDVRVGRVGRIVGTIIALSMTLRFAFLSEVDCVVGLAGCAVIAAMFRILDGKREWWTLLVCSLWMMTAKQGSLLTCFVLWAAFSLLLVWHNRVMWRRRLLQLSACGAVLVIGFMWICSWPYVTSWVRYGHPLYPAYTVDAERYPTYDITGDFEERNEDARAMSPMGTFCYAYISTTLTRAYYAWKLDRPDFLPKCGAWGRNRGPERHDVNTPLTRGTLVLAFLVVLLFGHRVRLVALLCIVALIGFLPSYYGYMRYITWMAILYGLAMALVIDGVMRHLRAWGMARMVVGYFAVLGCILFALRQGFGFVELRDKFETALRKSEPVALVFFEDDHNTWANTRLLYLQTAGMWEQKPKESVAVGETYERFYCPFLELVVRHEVADGKEAKKATSLSQRLLLEIAEFPRTYLIKVPRLAWWRLQSLWRNPYAKACD